MKLEYAQRLGERVFEEAKRRGFPPLAVVILDAGGRYKYAACQDGTGTLRFNIAHAKANAAIGMGMSTRDLYNLFEQGVLNDRFSAAITGAADGRFAPQPGGELVTRNGTPIGAIGVSGASSDQDELVARIALRETPKT